MFDYSAYSSVMQFEMSGIDLWSLRPRDVRNLTSFLLIPELLPVTDGKEFETLCFGYYADPEKWENNPFKGEDFMASLERSLNQAPPGWDPRNPAFLFPKLLLYYIKDELRRIHRLDRDKARRLDVAIVPTLGTDVDFSYSTDLVVVFGGTRWVTCDLTSDPGNASRADVTVYRHELMVSGGIMRLAHKIVRQYYGKWKVPVHT